MTPRELVLTQFPDRIHISVLQAGAAVGLNPDQVCHMCLLGTLPFPVRYLRSSLLAGTPVVTLTDLIAYLEAVAEDRLTDHNIHSPPKEFTNPPPKRRKGRPTKWEQIETRETTRSLAEAKELAAKLARKNG